MRLRIAVGVAALALIAVIALSSAVVVTLDEKEEEFIDGLLNQQIAHSMQVWASAPATAFPNTPDMQLFRIPRDEPPPDGMPADLRALPVGNHEIFRGGREFHVAVRADPNARYVLVYDVEDHEARTDSIYWMIFSGALLLTLVILAGSFLLAGRLAERLERLAERVERGETENLVEPSMDRELLLLAEALERLHARQAAAIERERAFAGNLSHEMRTPLTAIRTDAEMIVATRPAEAVLRRAERIMERVDRIDALTASLLLLAREARPQEAENVDLRATLGRIWEGLARGNGSAGAALELEVDSGAFIHGDPAFVELILRNGLDNALCHGDGAAVRCRLHGSTLVIANRGPGFAPEGLPFVFDGLDKVHPRGRGIGLALVRHVCKACGWQVSARNGSEGHAELVFDFGADLRLA